MDNSYSPELDFLKNLKAYFGPAFRAISVEQDFDFTCIMQGFPVQDTPGHIITLMWPTPYKNFYLDISNVEEKNGEWWLTTPNETWVLRKIDPAVSADFAKQMRAEGIDLG